MNRREFIKGLAAVTALSVLPLGPNLFNSAAPSVLGPVSNRQVLYLKAGDIVREQSFERTVIVLANYSSVDRCYLDAESSIYAPAQTHD